MMGFSLYLLNLFSVFGPLIYLKEADRSYFFGFRIKILRL